MLSMPRPDTIATRPVREAPQFRQQGRYLGLHQNAVGRRRELDQRAVEIEEKRSLVERKNSRKCLHGIFVHFCRAGRKSVRILPRLVRNFERVRLEPGAIGSSGESPL